MPSSPNWAKTAVKLDMAMSWVPGQPPDVTKLDFRHPVLDKNRRILVITDEFIQ
jgi:hypothetical protein